MHSDRHHPKHLRKCEDCHINLCSFHYEDASGHEVAQLINIRLMGADAMERVLTLNALKRHFAASRVTKLLQKLDEPICSHIRFSDPSFIKLYDPEALELRKQLGPYKWLGKMQSTWPFLQKNGSRNRPWICPAPKCQTEIWFEVRQKDRLFRRETLYLILVVCVRRSILPWTGLTPTNYTERVSTHDWELPQLSSWYLSCAKAEREHEERTVSTSKIPRSSKSGAFHRITGSATHCKGIYMKAVDIEHHKR